MISTLSGQQSHKILLMQYTFVLLHSQINCNRFFRPGEIHWLAHHWLNIEKQQISAKAVFYGTLCQVTQFWLKIINISLEMTISRRTGDILTFGLLVPLDWTVIDKSVLKKKKKNHHYYLLLANSNKRQDMKQHQQALQEHFTEKEQIKRERESRPTFQTPGLLPELQQGSFQVFHLHVLPTHTQPASFCMCTVCSHAPAAFSCSPTSSRI